MSCMKTLLVAVIVATSASAADVEYESWKQLYGYRVVTKELTQLFEGVTSDLNACLKEAEKFPKPEKMAVALTETAKEGSSVCRIYKESDLGSKTTKAITWDEEASKEDATEKTVIHMKKAKEVEKHEITEAGIVMTIILSIVYSALLVACALTCKEGESDISAQLEDLKRRELEVEEAVSEHWERESQAAEAKEMEAAKKEMEQALKQSS